MVTQELAPAPKLQGESCRHRGFYTKWNRGEGLVCRADARSNRKLADPERLELPTSAFEVLPPSQRQLTTYLDGLGSIVTCADPFLVGSVAAVAVTLTVAGFGTVRGAV